MTGSQSISSGVNATRTILCTLAVLGLCALPSLSGAQELAITTDALTRQADLIVVGKVSGLKAGWASDRSRILTTVTLAVDQTLKGKAGSGFVTIVVPGGEVDGVGELYSHTARFSKDEDVVVFAAKDKKGDFRVTGGSEGKVSIRRDEISGRPRISDGMNLDDFTNRIKSAVQTQESETK